MPILLDTRADVAVRVRSGVVTVQVEQTVVLVLVVVTTYVQHNTTGVVVAIIRIRNPDYWYGAPDSALR